MRLCSFHRAALAATKDVCIVCEFESNNLNVDIVLERVTFRFCVVLQRELCPQDCVLETHSSDSYRSAGKFFVS